MELERFGRSLPHLLRIVTDLKARGVAFRSLTEQMDTTTPHGELLFSLFGALAQYERALRRERGMAGRAAAKRRGRQVGRPPMIDAEALERITAALGGGASKASVCRTFKVPRSTLLGTLARIGWTAPAKITERHRATFTADTPYQLALMSAQPADRLTRSCRTKRSQRICVIGEKACRLVLVNRVMS